jgi:hypothetical protein
MITTLLIGSVLALLATLGLLVVFLVIFENDMCANVVDSWLRKREREKRYAKRTTLTGGF